MVRKRGPAIGLAGVFVTGASFLVVLAVVSDAGMVTVNGESLFLPDLLDGMFDEVTDRVPLHPGESAEFSYSVSDGGAPLMWGVQTDDYEEGDRLSVGVSDARGRDAGEFRMSGPAAFNALPDPGPGTLGFVVLNEGDRRVAVSMVFLEDPENSRLFNDPDSPLNSLLLPLAAAGAALIAGIAVIAAGAVVSVYDWRKKGRRPSWRG